MKRFVKFLCVILSATLLFGFSANAAADHTVKNVSCSMYGDGATGRGFCWFTTEKSSTDLQLVKTDDFTGDFANAKSYTGSATQYRSQYSHKVAVTDLEPGTAYTYRVGDAVKAGDRLYLNNRGKSLFALHVGTEPIEEGVRICAAHIDSPRLDLKPMPLYEDRKELVYLKTHYYGGIKKYQWTALPLALHGIVVKKDGKFYVLEASNVVKLTPIDTWCERGRFSSVKKRRVLDKDVKVRYSQFLGKPYDLAFKFDNGKYYCSELVWLIYKEQFGIELCKPRKIKEYNLVGIKKHLARRGMNENQLVVAPSDLLD